MRQFLTAWEFWVVPLLAVVAIGCLMWMLNHNQDLRREQQFTQSTVATAQRLAIDVKAHNDAQSAQLREQVGELKREMEINRTTIKELLQKP